MDFFIINKKKFFQAIAIILLVFGAVFFGVNNYFKSKQIQQMRAEIETQKTNNKVVVFMSLFIKKVLKSEGEISFEDRLQLETAVRNIEEPSIMEKWEKFTTAETESEVQGTVKDLLEILVKKIVY